MAYTIAELRRSKNETGQGLVIEDYSQTKSLCRKGTWTGLRTYFIETVVLDFPHDDNLLAMAWVINGIIWPGVAPFTGGPAIDPLAGPVKGVPGIRYYTPVDGFYHRLALYSEPGAAPASIHVQVFYTLYDPPNDDGQYSPSMMVKVSGASTKWSPLKIEEEARCHARFAEVARRYVRWEEPAPLDPVIFERMPAQEAVQIKAMVEELEHLGDEDGELGEAIRAELTARLRRYVSR